LKILKINGVEVPSPVGGAWDDGSIAASSSGRDSTGYMNLDIVTEKRNLPYTWGLLSASETSTLLKAVKMNGIGNINVTVHNPEENKFQTYNCYAGDRHVPIGHVINGEIYYNGISITFIEN
jgi:hypothetical protein